MGIDFHLLLFAKLVECNTRSCVHVDRCYTTHADGVAESSAWVFFVIAVNKIVINQTDNLMVDTAIVRKME